MYNLTMSPENITTPTTTKNRGATTTLTTRTHTHTHKKNGTPEKFHSIVVHTTHPSKGFALCLCFSKAHKENVMRLYGSEEDFLRFT